MPNDPYYHTKEWKHLRAQALKRDGYRCTVNGCPDRATHVDHIISRRERGPDELFNLRSLCSTHDAQIKERAAGRRSNDGKPRLIGCGVNGWPYAR